MIIMKKFVKKQVLEDKEVEDFEEEEEEYYEPEK